jgi:hypothetical protein
MQGEARSESGMRVSSGRKELDVGCRRVDEGFTSCSNGKSSVECKVEEGYGCGDKDM